MNLPFRADPGLLRVDGGEYRTGIRTFRSDCRQLRENSGIYRFAHQLQPRRNSPEECDRFPYGKVEMTDDICEAPEKRKE